MDCPDKGPSLFVCFTVTASSLNVKSDIRCFVGLAVVEGSIVALQNDCNFAINSSTMSNLFFCSSLHRVGNTKYW